MKKIVRSLIATAAIFITAATTVQAEQITVHKGDTLWSISKQYGVSVESIKKWNNLADEVIHPNAILEVSPVKQIVVKKGDSLSNIARVHGVSVHQIKKWNNLASEVVNPGTNLIIYMNTQNDINVTTSTASVQPVTGKELTVTATAYTANCAGCSGITKTGVNLKANPAAKVIAVDPAIIPLGSKVHVEGYGYATASDIGGAIKGNRIDVFVPEHNDALAWGRKQVKVTIID